MMRWLTTLIFALGLAAPALAQPVNTGHLTAELVAQSASVAPGQTTYVALRQQIIPGWHTYWRNAGDSGEPTQIAWTLPAGWKAGDIVWPAPKILPIGPLVDYGYEGQVLLPVPVTAPADARPGQTATLRAKATFLVCKEVCVPEDASLTIAMPVVAAGPPADPTWSGPIAAVLAAAPKPAGLAGVFQKTPKGLTLAVTGPALKGAADRGAYFYPYDSTVIDHAKPQVAERGPEGLTLTLAPGYAFQAGAGPRQMTGVLAADGKVYEVSAQPGTPPAGAAGLGAPAGQGAAAAPGGAALGLLAAVAFAFVGGLILNLMPCVFPILAMKAASLAAHGGREQFHARRHGLAFGAGVLASFLGLAGGLIALKAAGSAVGWGFQLQSPPIVAALALLMLAVALDLSGVFEVGTSLQGAGAGLAARGGLAGDFFTGVLAVVVAAPCTAPFMGAAIGWALTQSAPAALAVFLALGVGFAAPFVAVAFAPALLKRLPRPGPWMDLFRKVLAFPMYGAAAWLVWVLTVQAGAGALAQLLTAAVVLAAAAWMAGAVQRGAASGPRRQALGAAALLLAGVAGALAFTVPAGESAAAAPAQAQAGIQPYSPQTLADLRAQGRPVFVDYTAAWCVSCQVNERVVLATAPVQAAMKTANAVYLKADWTRRDPAIAADLARFGRAGVPLYLVYGPAGDPQVLPAILTQGVVIHALEAAAKRS